MFVSALMVKALVSVALPLVVAVFAAVFVLACNSDKLNRDVADLGRDNEVLRDTLASVQEVHFDGVTALAAALHELRCRVNDWDEWRSGSSDTCDRIAADLRQLAERHSEASSALFGAAGTLRLTALRYEGKPVDEPEPDDQADDDDNDAVTVGTADTGDDD